MSETTLQQNGVLDTEAWMADAVEAGKKLRADYEAYLEDEKKRIAMRKRKDHRCNCSDCGKFLPKELWLPLETSPHAIKWRPICYPCRREYDIDF